MNSTADQGVRALWATREIRRRFGAIALAVAAAAGMVAVTGTTASALPNCGGNQTIQIAPVTCQNQRTIDGTTFSVVLNVSVSGAITATYSLDAPRSVDTPIRMRSHHGISSNPNVNEAAGTIPAGATSAVLSNQSLCGQIDVKAVFTGNGDARGRIAAPYVTTPDNCGEVPPTTAPPTTRVPTTAPPTSAGTTPTTSGSTTPSSVSQNTLPAATTTPSGGSSLPTTGSGGTLLVVSALLLAAGVVLVTKGRDRHTVPE